MRLGIVAYVVPFIFAFHPALLLKGPFIDIMLALASAVMGVLLMSIGLAGFLFRPLDWFARAMAILAGLLLIPPPAGFYWLITNVTGFVIGVLFLLLEWNGLTMRRVFLPRVDRSS